jgi:hypothetical protein
MLGGRPTATVLVDEQIGTRELVARDETVKLAALEYDLPIEDVAGNWIAAVGTARRVKEAERATARTRAE